MNIKYTTFYENGERIYRGEGQITFICYYPYAHTPVAENYSSSGRTSNITYYKKGAVDSYYYDFTEKNVESVDTSFKIDCMLFSFPSSRLTIKLPAFACVEKIRLYYLGENGKEVYKDFACGNATSEYTLTVPTGGLTNYTYITQICYICKRLLQVDNILGDSKDIVKISFPLEITFDGQYTYVYKYEDGLGFFGPKTSVLNKKILNHYTYNKYPTKHEWYLPTGLYPHTAPLGENFGELPSPFKVTKNGLVSKNSVFKVGDTTITTTEDCYDFEWDSQTGLVTGKKTTNGEKKLISYLGLPVGTIPVTGLDLSADVSINGGSLSYDYWYY